MTTPFRSKTAVAPRKWYQRLFSTSRPDPAAHRIANLFVDRDPRDVATDEIVDILRDEQVLGGEARRRLVWVWKRALEVHLEDDLLADDEMEYLERLRVALNLSTSDVDQVRHELAQGRFREAVEAAFADGSLSARERVDLADLRERLRVPSDAAQAEYSAAAADVLRGDIDRIIASQRYSLQDEERIRRRAEDLGVANLSFGPDTEQTLSRLRLLWEVENGRLPQIYCGLNLQRGEVCHASCAVGWYEMRTKTVRVNYAGPTARIRVCKGVYFRTGSIAPRRITREELTPIDVGTAFITNKRLIFNGVRANKALRYSSLLGIEVFSDAIMVEKATGRSPYLVVEGDVELTAAILSTAMAVA